MTTKSAVSGSSRGEVVFDGSGLAAPPKLTPRAARALLRILRETDVVVELDPGRHREAR
jgi:hypothetical protein